jgi:hypothetical protein
VGVFYSILKRNLLKTTATDAKMNPNDRKTIIKIPTAKRRRETK